MASNADMINTTGSKGTVYKNHLRIDFGNDRPAQLVCEANVTERGLILKRLSAMELDIILQDEVEVECHHCIRAVASAMHIELRRAVLTARKIKVLVESLEGGMVMDPNGGNETG